MSLIIKEKPKRHYGECKTGKKPFANKKKALTFKNTFNQMARKMLNGNPLNPIKLLKGVYSCLFCSYWHVTSQERRIKPPLNEETNHPQEMPSL